MKQKKTRNLDLGLAGSETYFFNHPGLYLQYMSIYIYIHVYVRISTLDQNSYFDQKAKTVPLAQRRNEHG